MNRIRHVLLLFLLGLGLGLVSWGGVSRLEAATGAASPKLERAYRRAVAYARKGQTRNSAILLSRILDRSPDWVQPRVLLLRLYAKAGRTDLTRRHARKVLELDPGNAVALRLLREDSRAVGPAGGSRSPAPSPSSTSTPAAPRFDLRARILVIPGDLSFGLNEYAGSGGATLYMFPDVPPSTEGSGLHHVEARDERLYFLRMVDLFKGDDEADLERASARENGVSFLPFMILLDADGNELARGAPTDVDAALEPVRERARVLKQRADHGYVEPVGSRDFSSSTADLTTLANPGWQTVVMITSPG